MRFKVQKRFLPFNPKPGTVNLEPGLNKPLTSKNEKRFTMPKQKEQYDVVLTNGRVMDQKTNFDGIRNVGIKDGKIVAITEKPIKGKETIDATGHVVAHGFMEAHCHATDPFIRKMNLRDGLTTMMDFEAGARDIAKFYDDAEGKRQTNYGTVWCAMFGRLEVLDGPEIAAQGNDAGEGLFGGVINAAGAKAIKENRKPGWSNGLSDKEQMTEILTLMDEAMRQGALTVQHKRGWCLLADTQQ